MNRTNKNRARFQCFSLAVYFKTGENFSWSSSASREIIFPMYWVVVNGKSEKYKLSNVLVLTFIRSHREGVLRRRERRQKEHEHAMPKTRLWKEFLSIHLRYALTKRWPHVCIRAHKIIMREQGNLQRSFVINFFMVFQHLTSDWASAGGLRASVKLFWKRETKTKWKKINKTAKCTEAKIYKNFFFLLLTQHTHFLCNSVCHERRRRREDRLNDLNPKNLCFFTLMNSVL